MNYNRNFEKDYRLARQHAEQVQRKSSMSVVHIETATVEPNPLPASNMNDHKIK